jgi:hypothetical protein
MTIVFELHHCSGLAVQCACRYWNDPAVLSKLGQAMGVGIPGEAGLPAYRNEEGTEEEGEEDVGEEEEDELTVHHTASTGDVEVCLLCFHICADTPSFRMFCIGTSTPGHCSEHLSDLRVGSVAAGFEDSFARGCRQG